MDLRCKRTEDSLTNAFLTLRSRKPIEKISIRELTELAVMNKATFYRHYRDIYDLSDHIENELIENCLAGITDVDALFTEVGFHQLFSAFSAVSERFHIIFSGSRRDIAVHKIHHQICDKFYHQHPEFIDDTETSILLTTLIYGNFHAYIRFRDMDFNVLMPILSKTVRILEESDTLHT